MVAGFCGFFCLMNMLAFDIGKVTAESQTTALYHDSPTSCRIFENSDIIGLVAFCSAFQPNETSYILPNTTTRLQLFRVVNLSTNISLAPNMDQLLVLEMIACNLQNITSVMFEGLRNLQRISLMKNSIIELPPDTFRHNPLLESVDLSNNFLFSIDRITHSLRNLRLLMNLNLSKNKGISFVSNEDFKPMNNTSLKSLDLADCIIERIDDEAFKWFNCLASLNVSRNLLGDIALKNLSNTLSQDCLKDFRASEMRDEMYFSLHFLLWLTYSEVEYLDLSKNKFSYFPLEGYRQLKILNVDYCGITFAPYQKFSGMSKLEILLMKQHFIKNINQQFKSASKLKILDLSEFSGEITLMSVNIAGYAFENQKELEILYMNSLPLKNGILKNMFNGLSNLKEIYLSRCYIPLIEEYSFETLENLVSIDLSNNLISELANNTLFGLRNVRKILLDGNRLSFLNNSYPFEFTPKLEVLSLNQNKIFSFPSGMFLNLNVLGIIRVGDNFIQPWTEEILPFSGNLTLFMLKKNKISFFTKLMLEDLNKVELVDFSGNPINCSHCSTKDLQIWLESTNTSFVKLASEEKNFLCHEPQELKGITVPNADLDFLDDYCIPKKVDVAKIIYSTTVPLLVIAIILALVWYRWHWNIKYMLFLARSRTKTYKDQVNAHRYEFDAFVSYCDKDLPWIRNELLRSLETEEDRITCCLPDRDFIAGCSVLNNIAAAIEQSRTTLLILSNEYLSSDWCKFEAEIAQHKLFEDTRNGLILILLEPLHKEKITKNLQYVIQTRTCIQWTKNTAGKKLFWKRIRLAIMNPEEKTWFTHIT
ncbi:toll-like receptor 8 isoform X2 [Argiope bruennichi]|nr:toll-like receptor 8 isoform X2 [Argiope bruennichi]XP_055934244.1 toll-like receptor 8 isoform X2 [Argiope bruennichi]XP_055934245.1 toll-like receptor 8 isoform X2 [Argiope bruennichi]